MNCTLRRNGELVARDVKLHMGSPPCGDQGPGEPKAGGVLTLTPQQVIFGRIEIGLGQYHLEMADGRQATIDIVRLMDVSRHISAVFIMGTDSASSL
jgi:hypothetical protein